MRHQVIPSINVYFIEDNKVLLSRRKNTGWMDGYLCAPGGHVEPGETPKIAAIREVKEELGLTLIPDDLKFLCVAARINPSAEYVAYEFIVKVKGLKPKNAEKNKCSELVWAELDNLPSDLIPDFREVIEQSIIGDKKYLELGYD